MSGLKWITVVVIGFLAASVVVVVIGLAGIQVESSTLGGLHLILWFLFGWGLSRTFASRPQAQVDIESSTNTSAIEPAFPADPDRETRNTLLPRSKDVEAANTPTTPEPVMVRAHLSGWRIALGVLVVLIVAAGASFGGYRFALIPDTTTIATATTEQQTTTTTLPLEERFTESAEWCRNNLAQVRDTSVGMGLSTEKSRYEWARQHLTEWAFHEEAPDLELKEVCVKAALEFGGQVMLREESETFVRQELTDAELVWCFDHPIDVVGAANAIGLGAPSGDRITQGGFDSWWTQAPDEYVRACRASYAAR